MSDIPDLAYRAAKAYDRYWNIVAVEREALGQEIPTDVKCFSSPKWQEYVARNDQNTQDGNRADQQQRAALRKLYAAYREEYPDASIKQTEAALNKTLRQTAKEHGFYPPPDKAYYSEEADLMRQLRGGRRDASAVR